jgi:maltose/moltooligosaccharide transporter
MKPAHTPKPKLSFWDLWNMSFGFMGIQFGFALQNANASRILQTFGADVEHLSWFWLVAPLTGMIVQPIIGHYSDRTWTRLGRRRPYFLVGAVTASIALVLMPNSPYLATFIPAMFIGAGLLMILDASMNVAMEPFRALVADKLPPEQRTLGFSVQTTLIGIGAVLGSLLPYVLVNFFGVSGVANEGLIPMNVILSFYVGAAVFMGTILWTVFRTTEYSPEELVAFEAADGGPVNVVSKDSSKGLIEIFIDFKNMPATMKQLGLVQFFSWFALFGMWVFSTPGIAMHVYGATSPNDTLYNEAGNWVGILFGVYNGVSAIVALLILPIMVKYFGRKGSHAINLTLGGLGLASIYFINDPFILIIPMVGVGFAWASILSMPYAILAGSIPAAKMGIYMGIFNFFITLPQIINGIIGGPIVKHVYGGEAIFALVTSGVLMIVGAVTVMFVKDTGR